MHCTAFAVHLISHTHHQLQGMINVNSVCVCVCVSLASPLGLGVDVDKQAGAGCSEFSCMQGGSGPLQQTGSQKPAKLVAEATTGLSAVEGEVPIMMPAKLATSKACAVYDSMSVLLCTCSQSANAPVALSSNAYMSGNAAAASACTLA